MISATSADTIGAAFTETESTAKKDDKTGSSFAGLFSIISEGGAAKQETENEKETGSVKSKKEEPCVSSLPAALQQLYQLLEQMKRNAVTGQEVKEISSVMEAIAGVLEGNGASGDTDIAALLTGIQSQMENLGSEAKEAIMARMPQIIGFKQEPDNAATEKPVQIGSSLCPLENDSEKTEIPAQVPAQVQAAISENNDKPAVGLSEGTAPSVEQPENESGVQTVLSGEESAENAQNGDETQDSGIRKQEKVPEQAEQPEDTADRNLSDMDVAPAAAAADIAAVDAEGGVVNAVHHACGTLADLFSSYEEEGSRQFEIQLEPENLGKLSVTLSMSEDGLKALIRTKDAQVQSLLASEIRSLADKLSENGVQIRSLDVVCNDTGSGQPDSQNTGNSFAGQGSESHWNRNPEEILIAYEDSEGTQIYSWTCEEMLGSTVSYRA
jgi:flagellar hook-length control protein FliK